MAYNFDKNICDRCGITEEEAKKYPVDTGINHYNYRYSTSFYLGINNEVLCAKCHKEKELEDLFALMDKRDKKRKI